MDLLQFDLVGAVLNVPPSDCAKLARLCWLAETELCSIEDEPLAEAARAYAALFRACTMAGLAPGYMAPGKNFEYLREELGKLGLGDLLKPYPGSKGETTEGEATE